jgi:hypothetical protein
MAEYAAFGVHIKSINFKRSINYGFGVLNTAFGTVLHKAKLKKYPILIKD